MFNQDSNNTLSAKQFPLGFGLNWGILHQHDTLVKLDEIFFDYLQSNNSDLANSLAKYRNNTIADEVDLSSFLVEISEIFDAFFAELFLIPNLANTAHQKAITFSLLYKFKRNFIQRRALTKYPTIQSLDLYNVDEIYTTIQNYIGEPYNHIAFAKKVAEWLEQPNYYSEQLQNAEIWCAYNSYQSNADSIFIPLQKIDYTDTTATLKNTPKASLGFDFHPINDNHHAELQSHYCLSCHKQGKDSCRTGISEKDSNKYAKNDLGNILHGCPLDQKISEMITAARSGNKIASLAIAMIDNPMIAITGHRICNDCSKSCIFQKQSHVDVPAIESEIFNDVINLPMGVEIYNLLLLWNPLNISSPLPSQHSGKKVMVAGLGPSGFSMAYYMLRLGHSVIAIDGLKIEPHDLPLDAPIISWKEASKPLTQLPSDGFGGVAQYGITSRWDKNNLRIIRLILARFKKFQMHGGIMLGKSFRAEEVFETMGINHLCLAYGAGSPRIPNIPNILCKRIWPAADFLMNINLQKPYSPNSLANIQIRLPLIVFGAGLTAIDSAVEAVKYYIELVQKFAKQYYDLDSPEDFLSTLTDEDQEIAHEYLRHAAILSKSEDPINTLQELGGVKILYRNSLNQAPSYRLNHEEVQSSLAYGIEFITNQSLSAINVDQYGAVDSISIKSRKHEHNIPARTILIATGTNHHTAPLKDINQKYHDQISLLGDMDPKYHGSVVKALASSKNMYPKIHAQLLHAPVVKAKNSPHDYFTMTVSDNQKIADNIYALTIHAPAATEQAQAGQFFKLQLFNKQSQGYITEPIALSPSKIDRKAGHITFNVYVAGASTKICTMLKAGDTVSLMGSTGSALQLLNEHILLIGENHLNEILQQITTFNLQAKYSHLAFYNNELQPYKDIGHITDIDNFEVALTNALSNDDIKHVILALSPHRLALAKQIISKLGITNIKCEALVLSPMQCMMQGQCGRCLQLTQSGTNTHPVFTCRQQYLPVKSIDCNALSGRLSQNTLLEKITNSFLSN